MYTYYKHYNNIIYFVNVILKYTYKEASLRERELFSCSELSDSRILANKKRKKSPNVRLLNCLDDSDSGLWIFH